MRQFFRICLDPATGAGGGAGGAGATGGGAPDPLLGGAGGAGGTKFAEGDWRNSLPEDIRSHTSFQDIKDVGALAKSFIHAQSMVGKDKIAIPTDKSTPEEWAAFHTRLGRPEKADGYKFDEKLVADGSVTDKVAFMKTVRDLFHEHGVPAKAAEGIFSKYTALLADQHKAVKEADIKAQQTWVEGLKKEFGTAFEQKIAVGNAALKKFGGEGVIKLLRSTGLGSHPDVVKMFVALGQPLMDDNIVDGSGNPMGKILSPSEAQNRIKELKIDKEFVSRLYTKEALGHDAAVKEWDELHKTAYPEE